MPLNITIFVLKRTTTDLERSETHARSYLAELTGIIRSPYENVMPDLDDVIHVLEGHYSATLRFAFGSWKRGEEVLKDLHNPLANWCGEALEQIISATVCKEKQGGAPQCPSLSRAGAGHQVMGSEKANSHVRRQTPIRLPCL